ncbi:MAG: M14 family metallopeptidase [Candidatus Aminicenantales bacterium]
MRKKRIILISAGMLVSLVLLASIALSETEVKLSFDHFYDHAELTEALKSLERAYPQFVKVISLGKSYQGRDIWGVILNNPKTGPAEHKPGYYIDGNIHGNEIQGTEVALYALWYLVKNYGKTDLATRLLDEKAFYSIPTMNPDSRDYYINRAADPNSPRTGLIPRDDDRDGKKDEDGPEDLDGDGSITLMRKRDPNGNFKCHPDDPRIMIPVRPGEKGEYILLGQEGIDNDGDGRINEDPPGGYDMNRNYGYNWQPEYVQYGAGDFPFCWPETRATRDFLLAHPNIIGAQNFHNSGGMILRGPGAKNLGEYPIADRRIYDYIAKKGEKIIPGYRYVVVYKDMYTVYGGSIDFLYNSLGIYTFSNELDMSPTFVYPLAEEREKEAKRMKEDEEYARWRSLVRELEERFYLDYILLGEQTSEWKPYDHPLFGKIEIGGVKKFGRRVPPLFKLAETCHRNAAFCLYHADQLPRLNFGKVEVKKLSPGLFQIDVSIENTRVTPTISAIARQKKLHRADRFVFEAKNARLVAVGHLVDRFRGITSKIKTRKNFFWVESGVGSFGRLDLRLLVRGSGSVKLIYDSLKGGYYTRNVELK